MATGKIARLPRDIREQLNRRLEASEPGKRLVVWLNELPEVKVLLAAEFGGADVNEQNLSNWRQGGYRDWVVERRVESWGSRLAGEKRSATSEELLTLYTVRYLVLAREWSREKAVNPKRCMRKWRVLGQDIMKLRQSEHRAERLELDWERLKFGRERFEDKKQTDERRAMIGFLVAARQWPEVGEALAGAFRLLRERKGAGNEDGGLKMEDGRSASGADAAGHTVKMDKQTGLAATLSALVPAVRELGVPAFAALRRGKPTRAVLASLGDRWPQSVPQERDRVGRSATDATWLGVNWTEFDQIKVNQGEKIYKNIEDEDEKEVEDDLLGALRPTRRLEAGAPVAARQAGAREERANEEGGLMVEDGRPQATGAGRKNLECRMKKLADGWAGTLRALVPAERELGAPGLAEIPSSGKNCESQSVPQERDKICRSATDSTCDGVNMGELGRIKVNQGETIYKKIEDENDLLGTLRGKAPSSLPCGSPALPPTLRFPLRRGFGGQVGAASRCGQYLAPLGDREPQVSRSERDRICRSATDSTSCGVNLAELGRIKVNQGGNILKNIEDEDDLLGTLRGKAPSSLPSGSSALPPTLRFRRRRDFRLRQGYGGQDDGQVGVASPRQVRQPVYPTESNQIKVTCGKEELRM